MAANRVKMEPSVGKRILALLKRQGYRVSDVAKKTGYTREYFSRLLNSGKLDPDFLEKISKAIGLDVTDETPNVEKANETCKEAILRLETQLQAANRTIADLSAALRAALDRK